MAWSNHFTKRLFERTQPTRQDVRYVLCEDEADVIDNTREDPRGQSCLIWGTVGGRVAHVKCSYPPNPVIVTAYWPDTRPSEWTDDYRRRVVVE